MMPPNRVTSSGPSQPDQRHIHIHSPVGSRSPSRASTGEGPPVEIPGPSGIGGTSRSRSGIRSGAP